MLCRCGSCRCFCSITLSLLCCVDRQCGASKRRRDKIIETVISFQDTQLIYVQDIQDINRTFTYINLTLMINYYYN